jgi:NADH-quinone oxidoreductase subunit N
MDAPTASIVSSVTSSDIRAIFPVLLLFLTGLVVLVFDLFRRRDPTSSSRDGFAGAMSPILHLFAACGGVLALVAILAGWDAVPGTYFSGAMRIDVFSNTLSAVIVLVATLTVASSSGYLRRHGIEDGEFHALVLSSAGAMVLLVESSSLVMLFLSLETLSLGVYVLTGFATFEKRSAEGALKYFVLGGFSSGFLILGLALLYGATGELLLDSMAARVAAGTADMPLLIAGAALTLVGFAFKTGAFPFHSWIPDAYEGAPTLVTAFMSVAVKTAAFAALTRLVVVVLGQSPAEARGALTWVLAALAIATMVFGNAVAAVQSSAKRLLAYSGIAHTGYLLVGLVAAFSIQDPAGRYFSSRGSSLVFYLLAYSLMTFGAFLVMAAMGEGAQDTESLESFRGLSRRRPLIALAMLVFMVSLAGIPPTAGFWAKLYLFREAVSAGRWDLALVGILTSILAAYYYLRVVVMMYMQAPAAEARARRGAPPPPATSLPPTPAEDLAEWTTPAIIGLAAVGILWIGLLPAAFLEQSVRSIQSILARL